MLAAVGLATKSHKQPTAEFFNEGVQASGMDEAALSGKTVAELKAMLSEKGLAVSGRKADLVVRLLQSKPSIWDDVEAPSETVTLVVEENVVLLEEPVTFKSRMRRQVYGPINMGAAIAIGLAVLMISAVLVVQPAWLGFEEDYEYKLIEFDQNQALTYAENLVELGHPDWEGRMSGTQEEANAAQYIISEFAAMGMQTQLNTFDVPMHKVNSASQASEFAFKGTSDRSPARAKGQPLLVRKSLNSNTASIT